MNYRSSYEIQISDKLATLPVPDLSDAIWARIERQLDLDLPTDDDNTTGNGPSPSDLLKGLGVSLIFLATFFLIFKPNNRPVINNSIAPAKQSPLFIKADSTSNASAPAQVAPDKTDINSSGRVIRPDDPDASGIINAPVSAAAEPDSVSLQTPVVIDQLTIAPQTPADDTLKKKPRGVQNINPADYRIEPGKKKND